MAQFQWVHHIGSPGYDNLEQHSVDPEGNIVSVGYFEESVLIADQLVYSQEASDIFIYKSNSAGELIWVKTLNGPSYTGDVGVSTDKYGNIYVAGGFIEQLILDSNTILTSNDRNNSFLCKFDKNGNLIWVKGILGETALSESRVLGVVSVNDEGQVVVAANIYGQVKLDNVIVSTEGANGGNLVIAKYTQDGNLEWHLQPSGNAEAGDLKIDNNGFVYLTGFYTGTLKVGLSTLTSSIPDPSDIFLLKIKPQGVPEWAKSINKTGVDMLNNSGKAIDTDPVSGEIYLTGQFKGVINVDGIILEGVNTSEDPGNSDIFLAKISSDGTAIWAQRLGSSGHDFALDLKLVQNDSIVIAGAWNFNPFTRTVNKNGELGDITLFGQGGAISGITQSSDGGYFASGLFWGWLDDYDQQLMTKGQADGFLLKIGSNCKSETDGPESPILSYVCPELILENYNGNDLISWYRNGQLLENENNSNLQITRRDGEFTVQLSNPCGRSSSSIYIEPSAATKPYISYNIITPNGDNKNEYFILDPALVGSYLNVYDRWGLKVYENDNYQNNWRGEGLAASTYYWNINNPCIGEVKGTITILY